MIDFTATPEATLVYILGTVLIGYFCTHVFGKKK